MAYKHKQPRFFILNVQYFGHMLKSMTFITFGRLQKRAEQNDMISIPASRLPETGTNIFTIMSALAAEHNAINLSQGFPDFPIDPVLSENLIRAVQQGRNQYAPMPGLLRLREQIALQTERKYGRITDPVSEITITSGATEALFNAISALVRPGDEVIVLEPCYDSYGPAIQLSGGIPVPIELKYPDYTIPWEEIYNKTNAATRLIILNSPHNPTGTIISQEDIQQLHTYIRKFPVWIISDEVYEHITFGGMPHLSILRYPELSERAFVISSFGKTFHVTGWKTGYCIAPPALSAEFRKIHQFVTFCSPTPFQEALADMLENPAHVDGLAEFYQKKRDFFLAKMRDSRFIPLCTAGTYFQLMDYSAISDLPDTEFARELTIKYGVAAIPVSVFYSRSRDERVVRFCFAKQEETLTQAAIKLCQI